MLPSSVSHHPSCMTNPYISIVLVTGLTRSPALGGLEGLQPSKNHLFLVVYAGKAGTYHQKNRDLGEAMPPRTPPLRKSC
jgi:hypothetical protein